MKSSAFSLFLQHLRRDRKKFAELCSQLIVFMVFSRYSIFITQKGANNRRIILDTDEKTITVPWNYAAKLEEINRIIKDGGGDKQYTFKTYLEEAWKICMDDTDKHLKVADRPAQKGK